MGPPGFPGLPGENVEGPPGPPGAEDEEAEEEPKEEEQVDSEETEGTEAKGLARVQLHRQYVMGKEHVHAIQVYQICCDSLDDAGLVASKAQC